MTLAELTRKFVEYDAADPYAMSDLLELLEEVLKLDGGIEWIRHALSSVDAPVKKGALLRSLDNSSLEGWVYSVVLNALQDDESVVVSSALFALHGLQVELGKSVGAYFSFEDPHVRVAALLLMVGRSPDALHFVDDALEDPHYLVRMAAVDLIDDHDLPGFEEAIARLREDPSPDVRAAVETLERNRAESSE